jgi:hypothetical protein
MEMPEFNPVRKQPPADPDFTERHWVSPAALDTLGSSRLPLPAPKEPTMQIRSVVAVVVTGLASVASGESGFLRFERATDTVRIFGNTVFPTVDFTYEMRVRLLPGSVLGRVISEQRDTFEDKHISVSPSLFTGYMTRNQGCGNENQSTWAGVAGAWRHIAWVRSSGTAKLFVDGMLAASWTPQTVCTGNSPDSSMSLGMFRYPFGCQQVPSFLGDLDWIRVSRVSRYSDAFQPPRECEILSDVDTVLLLRFNESPGQTLLDDESPNDYRCELGVVACGAAATSPLLIQEMTEACGCPGDLNQSGTVDAEDLAYVLFAWGTDGGKTPAADITRDGTVDGNDLSVVLGSWGPCPN